MLEFWKDDRDLLRKAGWIYDPTVSTEKLRSQIDERERSGQGEAEQSSGSQPPQGEFGFDLEQEDGEGRS